MQSYQEMSREELLKEKESLEQQYKEICKKDILCQDKDRDRNKDTRRDRS